MWIKTNEPQPQQFAFLPETWRTYEISDNGEYSRGTYELEAYWITRAEGRLSTTFGTMIVPFSTVYVGDNDNPRPIDERTYEDFIMFGRNIACATISKNQTANGVRNWSNKTYNRVDYVDNETEIKETLMWMLMDTGELPQTTDGWFTYEKPDPGYYRRRL